MKLQGMIIKLFREQGSDGDLLQRYVAHQDEAAFGELVRRLGPMVLGVCRRVLGHDADADDAFQATFVVLARKASIIQPPGRVGAWLHGVANLAARKTRENRHRYQRLNRTGDMPEVPTMATPQCDELAAILDAELQAIPEKYRIPVVLCHLRDLTVAQAASELGWPVGTVASRLSRGRQWLAKRLLRRGITGAAGIFTTLWLPSVNAAPLALVREATHIALSDGASPLIHSLAEEVVSMMTVSSMRLIVAGMVACAGLALLGGGQLLNTTIAAPIPAAKALKDAKSNLDRVKLENPAEFLKIEAIRKELGLDDAIYKELQEFYDEKTKEFADEMKRQFMAEIQQQGLQPFPGLNLDFGNTQLMPGSKAEEEYIKKVNEKLKPEQLQRLKQLQLQMRPFNIFLDRIVIRELQLTAKQEDQLAELTKVDATTAMMFGNDPVQLANQTDDPKVWEAALNVLTDDQRKRWDAFIGKKIDAELLAELKRARNQLPFGIELGGAPPVIVGGAVPPPPPPVQPEGNPPPDSQ